MTIIGIVGYKGSGKTTITEAAIRALPPRPLIVQIGFADPIYKMFRALGIPDEIINDKSRWNEPLDILSGHSLRYGFTTLGTEWGRDLIGQNIWTDIAVARAKNQTKGVHTIIDNVRFPSEFKTIDDAGGYLIGLARPGLEIDLSHESEQHILKLQNQCDFMVYNDGTFEQAVDMMKAKIKHIIQLDN